MDDYTGPGDYSQRMFNLGACTVLIFALHSVLRTETGDRQRRQNGQ
jgi:hypothetical protein